MREVHLYGALGKEFGKKHRFDVASVPEAFQALNANFQTFTKLLRNGFYRVVVGKSLKSGVDMDESTIVTYAICDQDIHIIPVAKGRRKGGLGKILAGILLVGLSIMTGGVGGLLAGGILGTTTTGAGILMSVGTSLLLTGVASMLAPETKTGETEKSFTVAGPQVTMKEGGIVPIAYGQVVTGGTMISGILKIENSVAV